MGIDASREMVKLSKFKLPSSTIMHIDATDNPFKQYFDVAFSFFVVQWVKSPMLFMKGIYESLVPAGQAYIIGPLKHPFWLSIEKTASTEPWKTRLSNFINTRQFITKAEYLEIANGAKLNVDSVEHLKQHTWMSPEALAKFFRSCCPHLNALPASQHAAFISDVTKHIKANTEINDAGDICIQFETMQLVCTRPKIEVETAPPIPKCTRKLFKDKDTQEPAQKKARIEDQSKKTSNNESSNFRPQ